ncbi:hypothetical protein GKE82_14650 [Conexibacter sp. W3-3-2]|uniref:Flagellar protein FlgN n=1 Tax=Paraconexibacter algicola TaxID=2133960 RepID=A0A2T4UIW1_9ACTN|nr:MULTISPECIES: hypothetical protein [Solirubrobacterales]MTD45494.1 hypothetical protein [Conexibacter sp. W3-3-2]PTL59180.1 hypothetical protein C7Y72_05715 [Paraconexibacter algicola]
MSPAVALAALAEEELALVLDGRADELDALHVRREALMGRLMDLAPAGLRPEDRAALERAAGTQQLVTLALGDAVAAARAQLGGLHRGRSAAAGYARAAA